MHQGLRFVLILEEMIFSMLDHNERIRDNLTKKPTIINARNTSITNLLLLYGIS